MRLLCPVRTLAALALWLTLAVVSRADTAGSPWSKVPAFPTNCYQDQDPFYPKLEAAQAAVAADREKQQTINAQVEAQVRQADPMELANRLQQKMAKDPQNAAKYIQELQNLGQNIQATQSEVSEHGMQMGAEEKAVIARYRDALAKGRGPGNARWAALKKKLGLEADASGPGESGVPEWAWKEWAVIQREWDKNDQATCAQWWSATGPMHGYMTRYKDYLVQEYIPQHLKYDESKIKSFRMQDISVVSYKSTAELEAIENYLTLAHRVFSQRESHPRCSVERCD